MPFFQKACDRICCKSFHWCLKERTQSYLKTIKDDQSQIHQERNRKRQYTMQCIVCIETIAAISSVRLTNIAYNPIRDTGESSAGKPLSNSRTFIGNTMLHSLCRSEYAKAGVHTISHRPAAPVERSSELITCRSVYTSSKDSLSLHISRCKTATSRPHRRTGR